MFHQLDPAYTQSARARVNFRLAMRLALAFVALLWLVHASNWALDLDPGWLGVRPREWIGLAGVLFDKFMRSRADQLLTTVNVLALDYGFKQAVASGDQSTIRSALRNHAARAGATVALLLNLDGTILVSSNGEEQRNRARKAIRKLAKKG